MIQENKKILYIINEAFFFISHKNELASSVLNLGYEVHVAVPKDHVWASKNFHIGHLVEKGYIVHEYDLSRRGQNIIKEIISFVQLVVIINKIKPNILHLMTMKPIIYGGIISLFSSKLKVIFSITGLGQIFVSKGIWSILRKEIVVRVLKIIFYKKLAKIIVQNKYDYNILIKKKIASKSTINIIKGSGVNLSEFPFIEESSSGIPLVVLASRLLWEKGIKEFVNASKLIKKKSINARFILVGDTQPSNPRSVPKEKLQDWAREGHIEWFGRRDDMQKLIADSTVVCLPTMYGEGVPKIILEAAASGRVLVVSDNPGCTELVKDKVSGMVVPMGDSISLADAVEKVLNDKVLRKKLINSAYNTVLKEFSSEEVVRRTINLYK